MNKMYCILFVTMFSDYLNDEHSSRIVDFLKNSNIVAYNANSLEDTIKKFPEYNWKLRNGVFECNQFVEQSLKNNYYCGYTQEYFYIDINFIKSRPDLNWDFTILSQNRNIPIEQIVENFHLNWDWERIFHYHKVPFDLIEQNLFINWNWRSISGNCSLTMEIIDKYPDKNWDLSTAVLPNINMSFVKRHSTKNWNWDHLSYFISVDQALENKEFKQFVGNLSYNETLEWRHVKENLNLRWDWKGISQGDFATFDIVKENLKCPWNWEEISKREFVTIDTVLEYPNWKWNFLGLSKNKNITWKIAKQYPQFDWDWKQLLPTIVPSDIDTLQDQNWFEVSLHMDIDYIFENPHLNWKDSFLVHRRDLTLEQITTLSRRTQFLGVAKITRISDDFKSDKFLEWTSVLRIQRWWRNRNIY